MITPRCLARVTYVYPLLTFKFSDDAEAKLNLETMVFTPAPVASAS